MPPGSELAVWPGAIGVPSLDLSPLLSSRIGSTSIAVLTLSAPESVPSYWDRIFSSRKHLSYLCSALLWLGLGEWRPEVRSRKGTGSPWKFTPPHALTCLSQLAVLPLPGRRGRSGQGWRDRRCIPAEWGMSSVGEQFCPKKREIGVLSPNI